MDDSQAQPEFAAAGGNRRRALLAVGAAGLLLVLLTGLHLWLGSARIPPGEVLRILLGGETEREAWRTIVLMHRLPRVLTGILAGAALAVAGLQMQTLFRNPLAGPFVLGINSGASLAVALVVMGSGMVGGSGLLARAGRFGFVGVAVAGSVGAGVVMLVVLIVSRRVRNSMTLLVLGVMFAYATGALVQLLFYFSAGHSIQAYLDWTYGSFGKVHWGHFPIYAGVLGLGLAVSALLPKPLNAMLLGENYARSMGLRVGLTRSLLILCTALLAGAVTTFCGPIGFVGIAVPHLCRGLFNTADHRVLVPGCLIVGAVVASSADLIAQLPGSDLTLPLNAVTSLIGAPAVILVILRRRSLQESFA